MQLNQTVGERRIAFGGDYNPEQWPKSVWAEDHRLMRSAGVNFATVGVFSWAHLEPEPGRYDLDWLGEVLDGLHTAEVTVDLATATASPPAWLARLHPESLPVDREGRTRWPGGRQAYCPSSTSWRERALALVEQVAGRFGAHPALRLWHVGNEFGGHTARCYCDGCAAGFRAWLLDRYQTIGRINAAWGTSFWSQRYSHIDEVLPPRITPDGASANPTQQLDYRRFASDLLLSEFIAERDLLRTLSPSVPVTTNFMVSTRFHELDYWRWAQEVDVVSNDYYPDFADPENHIEAALCADITRGLAQGAPWLLMETSVSAVNWQPRNPAKPPGRLRRDALQQIARGADGFAVFQIRASLAGAEKFHSALIPHGGTDTRVWREVVELGGLLERLGEVAGSRVQSDVAIIFGYEAWWATELDSHPSIDVRYPDQLRAFHKALWELGVTADIVRPGAALDSYKAVVVPTLYLVDDAAAETVRSYVLGGGHALVTYFSGLVDENDHVRVGGYPGAFRDMLGILVEEFNPLLADQLVMLDNGDYADVWTEHLRTAGADEVLVYADGPMGGLPAVTRHKYGEGVAWYVGARTGTITTSDVVRRLLVESGAVAAATTLPGVEVVLRRGAEEAWLFVLNHTSSSVVIPVIGYDLVSQRENERETPVPAFGVAVVRQSIK